MTDENKKETEDMLKSGKAAGENAGKALSDELGDDDLENVVGGRKKHFSRKHHSSDGTKTY